MASRDLDRAIERLRAVASVVTRQRLIDYPVGRVSRVVEFPNPAPLRAFGPLRSSLLSAVLTMEALADERNPSALLIAMRSYRISLLDRNGREALAWHWQPGSEYAGPDHPHLHVSAAVGFPDGRGHRTTVDLDKLHLPTGPVSLAGIVRMLVEEFGVQPIGGDWRERLADEPV